MGRPRRVSPLLVVVQEQEQEQEEEQVEQEQEQVEKHVPKKKGRKRKVITEEQERLLEERALRKEARSSRCIADDADPSLSDNWEHDCTAAFFSTPHWWQSPYLPPAVDFALLPRLPHHFFPSLTSRQIHYLFCVADEEIEASANTNDFYYHHALTYALQRQKQEQVDKQEQVAKDRKHLQHMLQYVIRQRIDRWSHDLRTIDLLFLLLRDLRIPYLIPDNTLISRQHIEAEIVILSDASDSSSNTNERQSASVSM